MGSRCLATLGLLSHNLAIYGQPLQLNSDFRGQGKARTQAFRLRSPALSREEFPCAALSTLFRTADSRADLRSRNLVNFGV